MQEESYTARFPLSSRAISTPHRYSAYRSVPPDKETRQRSDRPIASSIQPRQVVPARIIAAVFPSGAGNRRSVPSRRTVRTPKSATRNALAQYLGLGPQGIPQGRLMQARKACPYCHKNGTTANPAPPTHYNLINTTDANTVSTASLFRFQRIRQVSAGLCIGSAF